MNLILLNFIIHISACIAMTGINWFVQLVHYPIISMAKHDAQTLENIHYVKTMPLAVPMLILELVTGIILIFTIGGMFIFINMAFLILILITTFGFCVPSHCELKGRYSNGKMNRLMKYHLFRTSLWTIRSLMLLTMLYFSF